MLSTVEGNDAVLLRKSFAQYFKLLQYFEQFCKLWTSFFGAGGQQVNFLRFWIFWPYTFIVWLLVDFFFLPRWVSPFLCFTAWLDQILPQLIIQEKFLLGQTPVMFDWVCQKRWNQLRDLYYAITLFAHGYGPYSWVHAQRNLKDYNLCFSVFLQLRSVTLYGLIS